MFHAALNARLTVLCVLLVPLGIHGNDLHVSPNGTPSGPGTMAQPYDLATALSGQVGQPGDTFWLSGGNYLIGHIDTQIEGAPGQPITFRQLPGERARIDGSLTFYQSTGNVVLRDFELYSSDTNRLSVQTGVGFAPTDIKIIPGIASYVPDMSFINLIVHDQTRHGFYIGPYASRNLVYGCLVYNNGWASTDNAEGHSFYVQGNRGTREISDNLAFNASGANFHIYENATNYYPPASAAYREVQIGRDGVNGSVALLNNYLPQELVMNNWTIAAVAGNLFASQPANYIVSLNQTQVPLATAWNDNSYAGSGPRGDFLHNSAEQGFQDWQRSTGYDSHSAYAAVNLSGTKVFVRPNRYEAGRANIIVYNWDKSNSVPVDVSSVLATNAAYEVRNAQDFFAPPVLSGVFDGNPLNLPMTGLTVAVPNGPLLTPPRTGPTFNVFVLLPRSVRLEVNAVAHQAQLSWPTNSGNWVLQYSTSLLTDGTWTDVTDAPAVLDDRYVLTQTTFENSRFYRLRAAP